MKSIEKEGKDIEFYLKSDNKMQIPKEALPLTIIYKGRRYLLILTKNDKLILNKYED